MSLSSLWSEHTGSKFFADDLVLLASSELHCDGDDSQHLLVGGLGSADRKSCSADLLLHSRVADQLKFEYVVLLSWCNLTITLIQKASTNWRNYKVEARLQQPSIICCLHLWLYSNSSRWASCCLTLLVWKRRAQSFNPVKFCHNSETTFESWCWRLLLFRVTVGAVDGRLRTRPMLLLFCTRYYFPP